MKRWQWHTLAVVVSLAGLFPGGCNRQPKAPPQAMTPEVVTVTIQPQSVVLTTELPGRTTGYLVAEIRPQVSGLIQKRLFTEGSDVQTGQILYEIDPAPFQAALDNALANLDAARKSADRARASLNASIAAVTRQQATLALARTNRQRYEDLFAEKAVSASQRDQAVTDADVAESTLHANEAQVESDRQAIAAAEAAIKQAEAAIKTAQINLSYTQITAPFTGRIGRSSVTDGAIVTAYQATPLATIQQLDPIYVDAPQSTQELLRLRHHLQDGRLVRNAAGQNQVELLLDDNSKYASQGTLQFRDVTVDPTTTSVILRMVFPNPDGMLLPGMFVRAVVQEGVNPNAIMVSQQAVSRDTKGNAIALVVNNDNKVEQRGLALDRAIGDQWLVSSGLNPGDRVIMEGGQRVRPGAVVKVVKSVSSVAGRETPAATEQAAPSTRQSH